MESVARVGLVASVALVGLAAVTGATTRHIAAVRRIATAQPRADLGVVRAAIRLRKASPVPVSGLVGRAGI